MTRRSPSTQRERRERMPVSSAIAEAYFREFGLRCFWAIEGEYRYSWGPVEVMTFKEPE